jgi:hypothetical protein
MDLDSRAYLRFLDGTFCWKVVLGPGLSERVAERPDLDKASAMVGPKMKIELRRFHGSIRLTISKSG